MPNAQAHLAFAALAALLAVAPLPASAEGLHLTADVARGLQGLEDGAARLQRARAALEALQAHRPTAGKAADWEGAPAVLQAAADLLRRAEGPALPDASGYAVPADQLRACPSRPAALARADRLQRSAQADAQRAGETRTLLRERLAQVQQAEESRRALLAGTALVARDEAAAALFTWRWTDLDRPLAAALLSATAELRRWLERVERTQAELKARAASLSAQQADWGRARDCALAGQWAGTRKREGTMAGLALRLAVAGNGWTGTLDVDGVTMPVKKVTLAGSAVSMAVGDGQGALRATLSADDQVLKGTYSSIDGPATFTLRRQ
jgi:hypothetical protein